MKNFALKALGWTMLAGILFGLFVLVAVPYEMYRKAKAEEWPSRKGVITLSYASAKRGKGMTTYWVPEICGNYLDTRERFCITRVGFGSFRWGEGESLAREMVARYPKGREVDVHYDPETPKQTLLEAKSSWKEMHVLLGLGLFSLLLPLVLWLGKKVLAK